MATISNPTAYVPVSHNIEGVPGWAKGEILYVPYLKTTSCQAEEAVLNGIRDQMNAATTYDAQMVYLTQLLALTVKVVPNPPANTNWEARNCGSPGTGTGSDRITGVVLGQLDPEETSSVPALIIGNLYTS